MARYNKGANAERELLHLLWKNGFAVVRAAGSGGITVPCPDVMAIKGDKKIVIECKAWGAQNLSIKKSQIDDLVEFASRAQSPLIIAWKITGKGWQFLNIRDFNKTEKFYTINQKNAFEKAISHDILFGD
ncbi:MAG: Holliday junction resolvase [Candidatus Diapherotrites archaeon]|nr:Holliday junction resolvase [Candidatus Diapherotrites archaeon]